MSIQGKIVRFGKSVKNGTLSWSCEECGESFLTEEALRMHREVKHENEFMIFRCMECGVIKQHLADLHAHAERHTPFYSFANVDRLMEYTEKLKITDYEELEVTEGDV